MHCSCNYKLSWKSCASTLLIHREVLVSSMFGAANTDDDQNGSVDDIIPWQGLESTTKS